MLTKMYQEMMIQKHGDWADFFMDSSLECDEAYGDSTAATLQSATSATKCTKKQAKILSASLEAA